MGKTVHNNYITISKAIGIILMVIGHSGCPQLLFKFIYLFHMPLFFVCSGFFYKEMASKEDTYLYVKKRFVRLYIPFVKWSVVFLLLHNLFMLVGIYNPYYGFEGGSFYYTITEIFQKLFFIVFTMHDYEDLLGGFWFIRALFVSSLLVAAVSFLVRRDIKHKFLMIGLLFFLITILIRRFFPDPEFWRDISMGSLGAMFYMFGFFIKQYEYIWKNIKSAVICCIPLIFSFYYFKDGISMGCGYNKVFLFSVSAFAGTLLVLFLSQLIEDKVPYLTGILYYIGNHTLEILALHFLSFKLVSCMIVLFYGIDSSHIAEHPVIKSIYVSCTSWWIPYTIVGVVFPLLLNYIWLVVMKIFKTQFI